MHVYLFFNYINKPMKIKIAIICLLLINLNCFAQAAKHNLSSGKIIFDISYPESHMDESTKANLPKESIMYFKNDKVKVEINMPMGKTTVISNNTTGDGIMLMNMMGNKMAVKMDKDDILKEKSSIGKATVSQTRESKVIAGYTCYKAVITIPTKDGDKTFDAWYTHEIKAKNSFSSQIEGVDGFMMEFINNQNGMNMKMTARSVEAIDITDSEFDIPEGYEVKTMEDLKKMGR